MAVTAFATVNDVGVAPVGVAPVGVAAVPAAVAIVAAVTIMLLLLPSCHHDMVQLCHHAIVPLPMSFVIMPLSKSTVED